MIVLSRHGELGLQVHKQTLKGDTGVPYGEGQETAGQEQVKE